MTHVLIADDDLELGELLVEYLTRNGIHARSVATAEKAMALLDNAETRVDVLVLDVMLPGIDGLTALKRIRTTHQLPILMLSGRGEPVDRVVGLELGADDYLSKPCLPRELLARIGALARRSGERSETSSELDAGTLSISPAQRRAFINGHEITLTGAEFDVLCVLVKHAGKVVSREKLTELGLHRSLEKEDRAIDVHISRLRKKLHNSDNPEQTINSIRGSGYILVTSSAT